MQRFGEHGEMLMLFGIGFVWLVYVGFQGCGIYCLSLIYGEKHI